ncbi:MAG TPA: hypothetical protein VFM63_14430 [Pyrinomonadaceae bacterium]|nr:hypothetical protein [Pyrinomonadaceae bacterium]
MGIKLARSILLILVTTIVSFAQSVDVGSPTPVRSNTVSGKIAARDLGDSRLTDHYFAFTGTPGDLLITIQSTNLNGDLDVFTAVTLRPLLKLSLYAESTSPVTKGIYLRKREDLILRIEARSPNDDPGTYRLYFGGSFEALPGGPDIAEAEPEPSPEPAGQKGRRVSSVGARIEEPAPPVTEVAAAPTPAPTPEPTPEAKPVETPKPAVTEKSIEEAAKTTPPPRTTRGRRPAPRRQPPPPKETPPAEEPSPTVRATEEPKPKAPAPEPEPEIGPRLIIETNDGTLINRSMSTVKRVTIENGMVVVTGKDGKISRMLLINVVRMQIQP